MEDEIWTTQDGTKIKVGDLEIEHLRNILRMVIRKHREYRILEAKIDVSAARASSAYKDLSNPKIFFPFLDGGVYGSSKLQRKYGDSI